LLGANTVLMGLSRKGKTVKSRSTQNGDRAGDIFCCAPQNAANVIEWLGCLPLADRGVAVTETQRSGSPSVFFLALSPWLEVSGLPPAAIALG
jgi:hypothetical protein